MKTGSQYLKGLIFAAGLAHAGFVSAAEVQTPASPADAGDAEVLSVEDLEALAGGTGVTISVITDQTLTAVNTGNTVTGDVVSSGDANIGSNAFSGYDGVGNFVINTGHNNNLQSSVNVSIVLAPPTVP
jgi:hypothetical protein